jgi:hypothetical protein
MSALPELASPRIPSAPRLRRRQTPAGAGSGGLRISLAFITSTAPLLRAGAPSVAAGAEHLDLLGYDAADHAIYFLERRDRDPSSLPQLYLMRVRGAHGGRLVPVRSWYEGEPAALEAQFTARLAELRSRLTPMRRLDKAEWVLSTRVVQRRALRVRLDAAPIRKYVLQLTVRPWIAADGDAAISRATVAAYLRPDTRLVDVHRVPGEPFAIARIAYTGVPDELGHDKTTALLVPI